VYAYTDESGNTGLNLFDPNQPELWTGTLVSNKNLDVLAKTRVRDCAYKAGVKELHGSELGFAGIECVSAELSRLISAFNLTFIFVVIEKRFLAGTKFVDTVLDSGLNQAVKPLHYVARPMRLIFTYYIVKSMHDTDYREFWESYLRLDSARFSDVLQVVLGRIKGNPIPPGFKDALVDTLNWAIANPTELLPPGKHGGMDSPNFVALTLILSDLVKHVGEKKVVEFVHDEQDQFARALTDGYGSATRFQVSRAPLSLMTQVDFIANFTGQLEFRSSSNSAGVELTDVFLWLVKRSNTESLDQFPGCAMLLEKISQRARLDRFTQAMLSQEVKAIGRLMDSQWEMLLRGNVE
jgi:hypothetical protein